MEVRWYMDGGETKFLGHGCRWGRTWMEVRHIMRPGWVSNWTWMDTRCSFWDPHEGETWPGWRWDANIETWIEVSCDLGGCEMLISRQVSIIPSHFHSGDISPLSKFQNCISVPSCSHINVSQVSSPSKSYLTCIWVLVSTLYMYHLISIKVPRLSPLSPSHLHPGLVSSASRSQDSCISSFNVLYHLRPGLVKCKSIQCRPISNSFWSHDVCFTSIHILPHQHPGPQNLVSSPSMYRLTSTQVQRFLSHLHPCTVPLLSGSQHSYLTSKHVTSRIQPRLSFVSRLHPGHI